MAMIPAQGLIDEFMRMYREGWRYVAGAAQESEVDCSGAFVYAYRQFGKKIAHGSNAIARGYVEGLLPISEAVPGMAAFKLKKPREAGYDLPEKYRKGGSAYNGDLNDYYHIGLVDETGKYVLNAQGTKAGFTRTQLSSWGCVGRLNAVSYSKDKGESKMQTMYVTAPDGNPVRVRKQPSTSAETIAKLKVGAAVQAGEDVNGWRPIEWNGGNGYMMSKFLSDSAQNASGGASGGQVDNHAAYVRTLSTDEYNRLCEVRDHMEEDLKFLKTIVGVG